MSKGTKRGDLTGLQRAGLEHLEACAREGVTIQAYARRRRLSAQRLYQLAKVLRGKGLLPPATHGGRRAATQRIRAMRKPRFVEVKASALTREPSDLSPATWRARLPNGVVLEGSMDLGGVVEALAKL